MNDYFGILVIIVQVSLDIFIDWREERLTLEFSNALAFFA